MEVVQQATQNIDTLPQLFIWLIIVFTVGAGWLLRTCVLKLFKMADDITGTNKELVGIVKSDLKETNVTLKEVLKEVRK